VSSELDFAGLNALNKHPHTLLDDLAIDFQIGASLQDQDTLQRSPRQALLDYGSMTSHVLDTKGSRQPKADKFVSSENCL